MINFVKSLLLACILLSGCAQNQMLVEQAAFQLKSGEIDLAVTSLEAFEPSSRDVPYHLLNLGLLKFKAGDYQASIQALESAKTSINALQTSSITENLQAASVNETLRSYVGTPSERVLIHFYLALSYLGIGDFSGARVEILQANVLLQEPAYEDSLSGELASVHLLSAWVFEMNQEYSNARISYAKALSIMRERKQNIPHALKLGLLTVSYKLSLKQEYEAYKKEFDLPDEVLNTSGATLFLIYDNGLVSPKKQKRVSMFSAELNQIISLVLPTYEPLIHKDLPPNFKVTIDNKKIPFELLEDVNSLLREDLSQEMDVLTAMTFTRAVVKYQATKEMQNKSDALGLLSTLATNLSEIADLRNWRMLPAQMFVARMTVSKEKLIQFNQQKSIAVNAQGARYILLMTQDYSNKFVLFKK